MVVLTLKNTNLMDNKKLPALSPPKDPSELYPVSYFIMRWVIGPYGIHILAWLGTILAMVILVAGLVTNINENELNQKGVTGEATVTDRDTTTSSGKNGGSVYWVIFSYQPPGGTPTYQKKVNVTESDYKHFAVGEKVSARYVPSNPSNARFQGITYNKVGFADLGSTVGTILGALFFLSAWVLVFFFYKLIKRTR